MSPRSSNVRIHNTVADATLDNNPKVNSTSEYNHACMRRPQKRRRAGNGQCTQRFGHATKAIAQRALDNTNMIQMNKYLQIPARRW